MELNAMACQSLMGIKGRRGHLSVCLSVHLKILYATLCCVLKGSDMREVNTFLIDTGERDRVFTTQTYYSCQIEETNPYTQNVLFGL